MVTDVETRPINSIYGNLYTRAHDSVNFAMCLQSNCATLSTVFYHRVKHRINFFKHSGVEVSTLT